MDLKFNINDEEKFNVRVCALIKYQDMYLVSKRNDKDYYSLPGGRIKFGEDSKSALIRELKEELNYDLYEGDLALVRTVENFFDYNNKHIHEYLFIYMVNLNSKYYNGNFINLENPNMEMKWVRVEELTLLNIKPELIKGIIQDNTCKHMIKLENN